VVDQLTPDIDQYCWPASDAMNSDEIALFHVRVEDYMDRGIDQEKAEAMADALVLRDRARVNAAPAKTCTSCASFRLGYCVTAKLALLSKKHDRVEVGTDLANMKQNCPAYQSVRRPKP
jgi:hypothetical protein